jgi:hypothetical protein
MIYFFVSSSVLRTPFSKGEGNQRKSFGRAKIVAECLPENWSRFVSQIDFCEENFHSFSLIDFLQAEFFSEFERR